MVYHYQLCEFFSDIITYYFQSSLKETLPKGLKTKFKKDYIFNININYILINHKNIIFVILFNKIN